ncbi:MAG: CheR family methyltransferase [Oceanicaulis sp.]
MANSKQDGGPPSGNSAAAPDKASPSSDRPAVVGVGASAGGVGEFRTFVSNVPENSGIAWVLILHMAPDKKSELAAILQRKTKLPVKEASDDTPVKADHIYLMPPGRTMTIKDGRLKLSGDKDPLARRSSIDAFLFSLAEECSEHCGCALLSGAGSDGTLGLKAIKESGGLTLTQSLATAEYDSMLLSAVRTGLVDHQVAVADMPGEFAEFLNRVRDGGRDREIEGDLRGEIYKRLLKSTGHDFSGYKTSTVDRRIRRRMEVLGCETAKDYIDHIDRNAHEAELLFRDLLVGVTQFFRDPRAFQALADTVLPALVENASADDEIRIWTPGCATGEEAYSIAMLAAELIAGLDSPPTFRIFGSDIDENALHAARMGRYPKSIAADVSPERLERFFEPEDGSYIVRKQLREMCLFAQHNVLRDPPFSRIDMISCRNMMIYMNTELQKLVVQVFHYSLKSAGYLVLGPAEGVNHNGRLFQPVDKQNRIFKRNGETGRMPDFPLAAGTAVRRQSPAVRKESAAESGGIGAIAARRVLAKYAPAYVIIDENYDIVDVSGATHAFLELPRGRPRANLTAMAREGLAIDIKAAVSRTVARGERTTRDNVVVGSGADRRTIRLIVEPVKDGPGGDPLHLVVFQDLGLAPASYRKPGEGRDDDVTRALEQELQSTKERLQSTLEELETSNEELKASNEELSSVNEELQSSNEELETSKEELQSINEELRTVNGELNARVEDLSQANNDLKNLFANTQIAMLFLDRDLEIKNFTPAAKPLFKLRDHDIGRPLDELAGTIDNGELKARIAEVMESGEELEKEISTRADSEEQTFLTRVKPYRDEKELVAGAVLTFVDITERKHAEERLKIMVSELNHRVKNTLATVLAMIRQTRLRAHTLEEFHTVVEGRIQAMAAAHNLLSQTGWENADLGELAGQVLAPFARSDGERLTVGGDGVQLTAKYAVQIGLLLHELATNAAKHGAWSKAGQGRVALSWECESGDAVRLVLDWCESGGPKVTPPAKDGFGLDFIRQTVEHGMNGAVETRFPDSGFCGRITLPDAGRGEIDCKT